jgi:hypothetical protein
VLDVSESLYRLLAIRRFFENHGRSTLQVSCISGLKGILCDKPFQVNNLHQNLIWTSYKRFVLNMLRNEKKVGGTRGRADHARAILEPEVEDQPELIQLLIGTLAGVVLMLVIRVESDVLTNRQDATGKDGGRAPL